ncbi:hypothetical protein FY140_24415 (plasmid) [Agrobacterium tumefaciens]|uniref:Uncharacterized protein n=1 Tax=Agrobacterium tumefaciens TaxID=358 RepID=A0A4D7YMV8_AGRTU|nr:hypothetical protein [Agrobacterium tumefaciens]QCL97745.1 hypothetical protein CFBP7129_26395 [Agrobacterium tumefaciens]UXT23944.1 hypothetical protein FY140_24415 [Agrobacterium tumefaciens]
MNVIEMLGQKTESDKGSVRKYDKGERRFKHVGSGDVPEFEIDNDNPKKIIGKCPKTISAQERDRLLEIAIAASNPDREIEVPNKLYSVHEGTIYEAQTSDHGETYHAYPFRGKLSASILRQLGELADREECRAEFDKFVKSNIVRHGR